MSGSTNQLVAAGRKMAVPAAIVGAFALGAVMFVGHGRVSAATGMAAPMDDQTVSALTSLDHAMEAIASRVTPAVVTVEVTSKDNQNSAFSSGQMPNLPPGFQQFFGPMFQQPQQPQYEHGIGSGEVISPDGYILTNDHVVDGAVQIKVMFKDRRVLNGKVVGVDKLNDLSLIHISEPTRP